MHKIVKRWLSWLTRRAANNTQDEFYATYLVVSAICEEYAESTNSWQDVEGITDVVRPARYLKYDNHNN